MVGIRSGGVAIAILFWLVLRASPAAATAAPTGRLEQPPALIPPVQTRFTPPPTIRMSAVLPCLGATDTSACLVEALERAQPALRSTMALPSIGDLGIWNTAPAANWVDAYSQILIAARSGRDPAAALSAADSLAPMARLELLVRLCRDGVQPISATAGRQYLDWRLSLIPSPALTKAAADALETTLNAGGAPPEIKTVSAEVLAICRGQLGDLAGMNRALILAWPNGNPSGKLMVLVLSQRLDDALAFSEGLKPAAPDVKTSAADWTARQQARSALLTFAIASGHLDIADRAAADLMTAALAPDRPLLATSLFDSGEPAALAWLAKRQTSPQDITWVERADAQVRPGQPTWNAVDAIAVHRAWMAFGRTDRALALYDAVAGAAAQPPRPAASAPSASAAPSGVPQKQSEAMTLASAHFDAKHAMAEMLAVDWRWDEAMALGETATDVSRIDWQTGAGEADVKDRTARAITPFDKMGVLQTCAALSGQSIFDRWAAGGTPTPIELAAQCARNLAKIDLGDQAGSRFRADAALSVAVRAAQFDRPDLDRDMVALFLKTVQAQPQSQQDLDWQKALTLLEAARADLHARGKL